MPEWFGSTLSDAQRSSTEEQYSIPSQLSMAQMQSDVMLKRAMLEAQVAASEGDKNRQQHTMSLMADVDNRRRAENLQRELAGAAATAQSSGLAAQMKQQEMQHAALMKQLELQGQRAMIPSGTEAAAALNANATISERNSLAESAAAQANQALASRKKVRDRAVGDVQPSPMNFGLGLVGAGKYAWDKYKAPRRTEDIDAQFAQDIAAIQAGLGQGLSSLVKFDPSTQAFVPLSLQAAGTSRGIPTQIVAPTGQETGFIGAQGGVPSSLQPAVPGLSAPNFIITPDGQLIQNR